MNREITDGLADAEFWWLNNSVTIICSAASTRGRAFILDGVQIVKGLQASVTVYEYLKSVVTDDPARKRSVLVRIIVSADHIDVIPSDIGQDTMLKALAFA